jgi:hypothetical protein
MLRFPNPGSKIDNFVRIYAAAFDRLNSRVVNLDDIVEAVVAANLATSSGYMGTEAVARSTREDRSRDPLYNQLKMYAELFRTLGWLHSTPDSALNFTFTLLGEQVVAAGRDYWPLLQECILGIAYPTHTLAAKGDFDLRPFAFILRVMSACGGYLSRDEMIIAPLSAGTDRGANALAQAVRSVKSARQSKDAMDAALQAVATARRTQVNTLHNYTRWPIAVLRDSEWVEPGKAKSQSRGSYSVWALTEKGMALAQRVNASIDIRLDDAESLRPAERQALSVVAHYKMLDRAGFDIKPLEARLQEANAIILPYLEKLGGANQDILFSPFQSLSLSEIARIFAAKVNAPQIERDGVNSSDGNFGRDDRSHLFVAPNLVQATGLAEAAADSVRQELLASLGLHGRIDAAAAHFAQAHSGDTQTTFYPLVTHLFQLLGYRSDYSRAGVNYQRWDACVWISDHALPVEIKSPTEEVYLSTKAVRQALENKIILLARGGLKTNREVTSLVVGNRLPNERGDMSNLIDNVFSAYGMRLGVIDLQSLAHLTLRCISEGVTIDPVQLSQLRGFLDV